MYSLAHIRSLIRWFQVLRKRVFWDGFKLSLQRFKTKNGRLKFRITFRIMVCTVSHVNTCLNGYINVFP